MTRTIEYSSKKDGEVVTRTVLVQHKKPKSRGAVKLPTISEIMSKDKRACKALEDARAIFK